MADEESSKDERPHRGHPVSMFVPHNRELGLHFVSVRGGEARLVLPYAERLVGDPRTGILHGGAITTLIDSACGAAVMSKLSRPAPIATLDLRIDYLKPAPAGKDVTAHATCFKVTTNVAFVRGIAYCDDENDPIASAAGAFMVSTRGPTAAKKPDEETGK